MKEIAVDDKVWITAGAFMMDSNDEGEVEKPVHQVYLDGFYIDKFEVTNAQYAEFVRTVGYRPPEAERDREYRNTFQENNPPAGMAHHPVVGVSWEDSEAYCRWAGKRLPTEAGWEKTTRGGLEGKRYPWGDEISPDQANYDDFKIHGKHAL